MLMCKRLLCKCGSKNKVCPLLPKRRRPLRSLFHHDHDEMVLLDEKKPLKTGGFKPSKNNQEDYKTLNIKTLGMLNEHKKHHSNKHIKQMIKLMKKGNTFKKAHNMTIGKVGY